MDGNERVMVSGGSTIAGDVTGRGINLPPLRYLHPALGPAVERYVEAERGIGVRNAAVVEAQKAKAEAERVDAREVGAALAEGRTPDDPSRNASRAEAAHSEAVLLREGQKEAARQTYRAVVDTAVSVAGEWLTDAEQRHADALARFEAAAEALAVAGDDLTATGEVIGLLRSGEVASLKAPRYEADHGVRQARRSVSEALAAASRAARQPEPVEG